MATPDHGAMPETIQVRITFSIPIDTVLDPGPAIFSSDSEQPPEVRALIERRKISMPESESELLRAVQELLKLKEAVQLTLLGSIVHGEVTWQISGPGNPL